MRGPGRRAEKESQKFPVSSYRESIHIVRCRETDMLQQIFLPIKRFVKPKLLIATSVSASLIVISNAQDANSEQEQFHARVEQNISNISSGEIRAEMAGNVVRVIQIHDRGWHGYYEQLCAKF